LERSNGIKQKIVNFFRGKKGYREFTPLNDISFEIEQGEFFGIVGRNGSGKSTLLKSIAGIYKPTSGGVHVNGKLVPFIELGVGFNPDLTGRENVYLNGAMLGFSNREVDEMYDEIVDFAELREFMDEDLKNYSSGMQVRLAFSIAIRAKGDVLLLDEVLAVGDSSFQQKCYSYFYKLKQEKKTVVLVTHSMAAVERYCTRAMLIDGGKILKVGEPVEIAEAYEELFLEGSPGPVSSGGMSQKRTYKDVSVESSVVQNGKVVDKVHFKQNFIIKLDISANVFIQACNVGINIRNESNDIVFSADSRSSIGEFEMPAGAKKTINVDVANHFTNGIYSIGIHVVDESRESNAVVYMNQSINTITSGGLTKHAHSLFHPDFSITSMEE
jgi:ABC-2 type transport system ATP-binding protein